MHIDFAIALAGLIVGIVVGLTGMGGGALMTPILVIGFGIEPLAAVSSDLVAAVVMKPIGGGIHFRRGTVHTGLVKWLALGSVPGALVGSYWISHLSGDIGDTVKIVLGVVLLIAAAGMTVRGYLSSHRAAGVSGDEALRVPVKRVPTLLIGLFGGLIVGMTSVGSGSLMIVALMLLYPTLSSKELVGTDLVQAVPLVLAAAIGHLMWGEFEMGLTGSLLLGCGPGRDHRRARLVARVRRDHPPDPRPRARTVGAEAARRAQRGAGARARGGARGRRCVVVFRPQASNAGGSVDRSPSTELPRLPGSPNPRIRRRLPRWPRSASRHRPGLPARRPCPRPRGRTGCRPCRACGCCRRCR